jgi:uncharacterized cupredoxin-like copper-binding protein
MSIMAKGSKSVLFLVIALGVTLAACSGSASNGAQTVNVTLQEMSIQSSVATFTAGVSYHFVITNKGTMPHELLIMAPTPDSSTVAQARQAALLTLTSSDLPAGAAKTVDFTFPKAVPDGSLEMACHLPGHYEAGMHTAISVH